MTTTLTDTQALAHLASRLREDAGLSKWDLQGATAIFAELVGQPLDAAVRRVVGHATDPAARTPAAIRRPFVPAKTEDEPGRRYPAKAGEDCRIHPGEWPGACRACAVSDLDHPEDPVLEDDDRTAGRDLVAAIRARKGAAQ